VPRFQQEGELIMTAPNPATRALMDQAEAAMDDSDRVMAALAEHFGPDGLSTGLQPHRAPITGPLIARTVSKVTGWCDHVTSATVGPVGLAAWAPGKLRCIMCHGKAAQRIEGTREDKRCDSCRKNCTTIYSLILQLPPVIFERVGHVPLAVPVIHFSYGLCPKCKKLDEVGWTPRP
jgi:hypothetical protein